MEHLPKFDTPKIESRETRDKLRRAIRGWGRGNLEEALELQEEFGVNVFRNLSERYWKIKGDTIDLFRAMSEEEFVNGPSKFAGRVAEIQRLTSWTRNREFAEQWANKGKSALDRNGTVMHMRANQDDIAFFPIDSPHYHKEEEVVVADYHLKKDKLSPLE